VSHQKRRTGKLTRQLSKGRLGGRLSGGNRTASSPWPGGAGGPAPLFEPMEPRLFLDNSNVVINEIMYHPGFSEPGQADFVAEDIRLEYVELYNKGTAPVNLNGWEFTQGVSFTFPSVSIPAAGYLVATADPAAFHAKYPTVANYIGGSTTLLAAGAPAKAMVPANGSLGLTWTTRAFSDASWTAGTTGVGYERETGYGGLIGLNMPSMYNTNASVYIRLPFNVTDPAAFSNLDLHMKYDDGFVAYVNGVEVARRNAPASPAWNSAATGQHPDAQAVVYESIDIGDFRSALVAGTNILAIQGLNVSAADPDMLILPELVASWGGWSGRLGNSGQDLELEDSLGQRMDFVHYSDEGDWSQRVRGPNDLGHYGWTWSAEADGAGGKSLELINVALSNTYGQNWGPSTVRDGTPGAANSIRAADIAPMILDVKHSPAIPRSIDAVTVTATIVDEMPAPASVTLYWRIDANPQTSPFTESPMFDDGLHGDGLAGDGVYSATIDPKDDRTVVEFYVGAADTGGKGRTWPGPTDGAGTQGANALYQVDNNYNPTAAWTPGAQPVYRLIMTAAENQELDGIPGSGSQESNAQMNGTFISLDGTGVTVRYRVGYRNRGGGTRSGSGTAQNYHVSFPNDTSWQGLSALAINYNNTASQAIGSTLFQVAGLAAPEETPVQVRVNGANLAVSGSMMYGSYVAKEGYDSDFARNHFPDDSSGNLYVMHDAAGDQANLRYKDTNPNSYRYNYIKQTNASDDDFSDIMNLVYVLTYAPDATFAEDVGRVLDLKQWLRYIAADSLLGNLEGGLCTGFGDDYGLYRGMIDTRFVLVPWDMDTLMTFGGRAATQSIFDGYVGITSLNRLLTNQQTVGMYYAELTDLINTVFAPATFNTLVDRTLGGWVPQATIDGLKSYMVSRIASVRSQIPSGDLTASSALPVVNGYPRTTVSQLALSGAGDATKTHSVLVDGLAATWNARTGAWTFNSAAQGTTDVIVPDHDVLWSYLDNGTNQGTAWRDPAFQMDAHWETGVPELGYGETDQSIPAVDYIDTDPNTAGVQKNATTYFRLAFDVADASKYSTLTLFVKRDDGVVVYLNGDSTPVARDNIIANPAYNTWADSNCADDGNTWLEFSVDPSLLHDGTNVLAAEIHQYSATSGDITFNLRLEGTAIVAGPGVLEPGINRVTVQAFDGPDGTGSLLSTKTIDIHYDTGTTNNYPKDTGGGGGDPPPPPVYTAELLVRDSYLPGTPVLVRVNALKDGAYNRDLWDATATLTVTGNPGITLSTSQVTLRNGVGSALVTITGSGGFTLSADVGGNTATRTLADLTGTSMTAVSGTLSGAALTWSGVVHVTGDVLVPAGSTLTILPGTLVLLDGVDSGTEGKDLNVEGAIQSQGTADHPVSITAYTPALAWGEIHHQNCTGASLYSYTDITRAGRSPGQGHTGSGPALNVAGATITFDHASISDNVGKVMQSSATSSLTFRDSIMARSIMGPEISGTALLMESTWILEMRNPDDADGIYIHDQQAGQDITMRGGVIAGTDDDDLDQLGATMLVEDYILRDSKDKGLSQYNGEVTLRRVLAVDNARQPEDGSQAALSMKGTDGALVKMHLDHVTVYNDYSTGIGIQCRNKYGVANVFFRYDVTDSIIQAYDPVQSDYDDAHADIRIDYTDTFGETWTRNGTGNLNANPQFVAPVNHDYHLQASSPAIDAGDPAAAADPDLTRTDLGVFYYDQGAPVLPAGSLTEDTVWTPEGGPYRVTGTLTVPFGITLTIQPGTTVYFDANTKITIAGRLIAEGTPLELIRFTRTPGSAGNWLGLQFTDTVRDNRISYAVLEYARTDDGMVGLTNSNLVIDHATFDHTDRRRIRTEHSALVVRNSTFTNIFDLGTAPTGDNVCEHIWGVAPATGTFLIENNVFGTTTGHNDAMDIDGNNTGTVIQILNNVFLGGGDDAMDLEGNAYIEGNVFMHFHKDQWNTSAGNANVLSAGDAHLVGHDYVFVRNSVYDVDHLVQVKQNAFLTMVNSTVANCTGAAIYFLKPGTSTDYGRGAVLDGDIFAGTATILADIGPSTTVTINRSIVPAAYFTYGTGNIDEDPRLVNPAGGDFHLGRGSPAVGAGPLGLDMGSMVPAGARIGATVPARTFVTSASFTIGGPGIVSYKYRLNGGAWGAEQPVATPIALAGLASGDYTLDVIGLNYAGVWQDVSAAASKSWTVDTAMGPHVRLSEVLADNVSAVPHDTSPVIYPDLIELYNDGQGTVNLADWSLTDSLGTPRKYVFPAGTTIPQGGYLVVYADSSTGTGIHTGFGLKADGDDLYLFKSVAQGGGMADSVVFGVQLADKSIARLADGSWSLATPTFGAVNASGVNVGAPNSPLRTGNPAALKINEWLANEEVSRGSDFVELYNPDPLPVDLGGLYLTDNPNALPHRLMLNQQMPLLVKAPWSIAPLSFVAGGVVEGGLKIGAYAVFTADNDTGAGANHADFALSAYRGWIGLADATGQNRIDLVFYGPQTKDISEGRNPLGDSTFTWQAVPTPGIENFGLATGSGGGTTTTTHLITSMTQTWSYLASATDPGLGTAWYQYDYPAGATWLSGPGLLYLETNTNVSPRNTPLPSNGPTSPYRTYYFRTHFTFSGDPNAVTDLTLRTLVDDGAVLYLNGVPLYGVRMPTSGVTYGSFTTSGATPPGGDATSVETWSITMTAPLKAALRNGDNVLSAEVHQCNSGSTDIVWGCTLDANITTGNVPVREVVVPANVLALRNGLRVTELMYNASGGSSYEYIELKNVGAQALDLTGVRLTDAVDFTFPARTLAPNDYVLVVADTAKFRSRYGTALDSKVAGQYTGKLSDNGELVVARYPAPYDSSFMRFEYRADWVPSTNGLGRSLVIVNPTAPADTWDSRWSWRASLGPAGSPGAEEPTVPPGSVVFNEVMAHSQDPDAGDWIELKNTTGDAVDIGGWYLSDDGTSEATLKKYRILDNTVVQAGDYVALNHRDHFGEAFDLSEWGETLYLSGTNPQTGVFQTFDVFSFGPTAPDASVGRYVNSRGEVQFPNLRTPTMGYLNDYPKVGPVVINEVNYHPLIGGDAYIELLNISGVDVPLYDAVEQPLNTWKFTNGVDYVFPTGQVLPAGGRLLVVPIAPATFRAKYGIPASVQIFGPYSGSLENSGETITLARPGDPEPNPTPPPDTRTPYIIEDQVSYGNSFPWPTSPDGHGTSLERIEAGLYGNDVANWVASPLGGTAGAANSVSPPRVQGVALNASTLRGPGGIDPGPAGVRTVAIAFDHTIAANPSDLVVQTVDFNGNSETVTGTPAVTMALAGNVMNVTFPSPVTDGWVKVTLKGSGTLVNPSGGRRLDGETGGGSGRTYIFSAGDLPSGNGVTGGDAVFYVGSLRGDFGGPGGMADGAITDADVDGFLAAFAGGDPAADFRGAAFGATAPDGLLTPADIDAFIAYYNSPQNQGCRLSALPNPGPEGGPLSAGDAPAPVTLGVAAPQVTGAGAPLSQGGAAPVPADEPVAAAELSLLTAAAPAGSGAAEATAAPVDSGSSAAAAAPVAVSADTAPTGAISDRGLLTVSTGPAPVAFASDAAASTEAADSPDDETIDLMALPALEWPLGV